MQVLVLASALWVSSSFGRQETATWGEGGRREGKREGGWEVGKRGGRKSKYPVGNSHSPGVAVESPFSFPYRYLFPAFPPSSIIVTY